MLEMSIMIWEEVYIEQAVGKLIGYLLPAAASLARGSACLY
jgi:hypothetical protein